MRIILLTFILLSITAISTTSAAEVACECTISDVSYVFYGRKKSCTAKSSFSVTKENTTVVSLNGVCNPSEPNMVVEFFYVNGKTVNYIPKGLEVLFGKLTGMRFESTKLKYVTKQNLKPFPQLIMFASVLNEVQFIEKDLFMYNTKLEYVSFRSNKITYIDPVVFNVVSSSLIQLYLDGTAISCGFPQALTKDAVGKVLSKIGISACGNIDNAPPLYVYWLENQCGNTNENTTTAPTTTVPSTVTATISEITASTDPTDDCAAQVATKQAEKDAECDTKIAGLEADCDMRVLCAETPNNPSCPQKLGK